MNSKIYLGLIKNYFMVLVFALMPILLFVNSCGDDGPSEPIIDPSNKSFENIPSTEDIVMYEVNFRAFSATGDFQGVTDKLDHIKSLGTNVIWLMPIHPIGSINSVNSPYSVKNFLDVNPEFGTLDDFKNLVNTAHEKDMAVIIDWVANHTAWDNPWIENKSWYTQNSNGDIISPPGTNWQDVADLNFDNGSMRTAMIDAMKYWVTEANIDGFRCDAADFVPNNFWSQAISSLENIEGRDLIYLAEGARTDHFSAGFHMNYSWDFYSQLKGVYISRNSASFLFNINSQEYRNVPAGKHKLRFTTNHDESAWDETPIELFGGANSSLSAFVISTYLGGVPLVYGSQEVGVRDNISIFANDPINWTANPDLLSSYQKVLSIYQDLEALRKGSIEAFNHSDILSFKKVYEGEEVLIMVNVRSRVVTYELPAAIQNSTWIDSFTDENITLGTELEFAPFQFYIFKNQ